MENVIISPSGRQLRAYLLRLAALVAVMCGGAYLTTRNVAALVLGVVVVFGPLALSAARSRTVLSPTGIEVRRFVTGKRRYRWDEVAEIREEQRSGSRMMRVELSGGHTFVLPAPAHTALSPNPDFDAERDRVLGYRKRRHGRRR
ncbi:PH domain-containing protein [Kitasatospora sp. LaBMicrA B282]|uniref:PH domain-containing protein n=1 Tax=Kitasatospora sp. LaBMicrA B282 TaxID=3420949 RepID=UPI003D0F0A77